MSNLQENNSRMVAHFLITISRRSLPFILCSAFEEVSSSPPFVS
ncbi:hypothetical protein NECAME_18126 [Necator americanus]|uniref:Uncharacterized protein n=1 Tax=Necator americanus TaxID=51031 RepID=W2TDX9_NECAM|nr:hypothetical protein NECAME_18126 [Necator americanus]ETN79396.1 hypothetical protein NECAME_18126 [Necator americanus]